ncbi:hypothetical protein HPB51_009235 [Rhipicephalus microplus]|uniref:3CxxC-type domain-containing protein n=1 Tax=Rhipicephalus microplus TaxID=6941 RepID=A0A9J6F006_RHIMP|nr:hypothetical protein HPB51_009235 [Rhipicephalus microplus]
MHAKYGFNFIAIATTSMDYRCTYAIAVMFPISSDSMTSHRASYARCGGMEQVWQAEFQKLFSQYVPQTWYLLPVVQRPIGVNWQTFVDSAKVRFCCEECGHGWTSMKGRISFWFLLTSHGEGLVTFKLYGQQCDKCKVGRYEPAMWYPEEVVKVNVHFSREGTGRPRMRSEIALTSQSDKFAEPPQL